MGLRASMIARVLLGLFLIAGLVQHAAGSQFQDFPDTKQGVVLVGGKAAQSEAGILQALALLPQPAEFDIPARLVKSLAEAGPLDQYRAVLFCAQDADQPPLSSEEVAALSALAESGGLVLFFGEAAAKLSGGRTESLAPLLGASSIGRGASGRPTPLAVGLAPALEAKVRPWMEGGYALQGLTSARPLIGDEANANAAMNAVGKGTVAFIGKPITQARPDTGIHAYAQLVQRLLLDAGVARLPTTRETWVLKPLGPDVPIPPPAEPKFKKELKSLRVEKQLQGAPAPVVRDKSPVSAIVLAAEPTTSAREAAKLLQQTLAALSGAEIPILSEEAVEEKNGRYASKEAPDSPWETAILVGTTRFSKGPDPGSLPSEGFIHRAGDGVISITGRDSKQNGLELYGTLYGAMDFLEQQFGVRWLWPGESGTILPKADNLTARPLEISDAPLLALRKLRNLTAPGPAYHEPYLSKYWSMDYLRSTFASSTSSNLVGRVRRGLKLLGKSEEDFFTYTFEAMPWFATARAGMSQRIFATHAYDDWYERFHQEHPEWFALQADGTRVQSPVRPRLDKGNPEVIKEAAREAVKKLRADPLLDAAPISPNDGSANTWDMSEASRKLDPPNGPEVIMLYQLAGMKFARPYVALTDRVVTFYNAVAKEVEALRPGSRLGATAYSYYRTPPLNTSLDPSVVVFYTGLNYLNDSNLRKDRENWNGWASKVNELVIRPNAFHAGHGFPVVWVHKMAADMKHCYQTGMIGADWDSVIHHWATVGLNYYVLARLLWDPSQNVDKIVKDYCAAGFGPAAKDMEAYFRELERLTDAMAAGVGEATESALREEEEIDVNQFAREVVQRLAPDVFTAAEIAKLRGIFQSARAKAEGHPDVLERLRFLELGLDYAEYQTELYRWAGQDNPDADAVGTLLDKRQEFFSTLFDNDPLAINLPYIAWREEALYNKFRPQASN